MSFFNLSKVLLSISSVFLLTIYAEDSPEYTEEATFLKQIEKAYDQADYSAFFSYVAKYLKMYPDSTYLDEILALMGNFLFENQSYQKAIRAYEMIVDADIWKDIQHNYWNAQFALKNYEVIIESFSEDVKELNIDEKNLLLKSLDFVMKDQELMAQYVDQAIYVYESLDEKEHTPSTLRLLLQSYTFTEKYIKAADVLKKMAVRDHEHKETILFQLSEMQLRFDEELAMDTLTEIALMNGTLKSKAIYKKLELLSKQDRFEQIFSEREIFKQELHKEHLPYFHYVLGVCYLTRGEITQAEMEFDHFLTYKENPPSLEEKALSYLVEITKKKKDHKKFHQVAKLLHSIRQLKLITKSQKKGFEALTVAQIFKDKKEYQRAEEELRSFLEKEKIDSEKVVVYFELALLYFDRKNWTLSRKYFNEFVEKYPNSSLSILAWNYFIQSTIHLSQEDQSQMTKAQLIYDLERLLQANQDRMDSYELQKYMLLLAQTKYQTAAYEEAIETLKLLVDKNPSKKVLFECFILLAFSHRFGLDDQEKYAAFIEKAMEIESSLDLDAKNKISESVFSD